MDDLATLRTEISLYDEQLAKRPWIVVANKMDLPEAEEYLAQCKQRFPKVKFIPISAGEGTGMEALKKEMQAKAGALTIKATDLPWLTRLPILLLIAAQRRLRWAAFALGPTVAAAIREAVDEHFAEQGSGTRG